MQNARAYCNTDKSELHIVIDLTKDLGLSGTGKSIIVAKSEGWQPVDDEPTLAVNLNVIRKLKGQWRPMKGVR